MTDFAWYDVVGGDVPLGQGDFFDSCPIVSPFTGAEPGQAITANVVEYDVVILSQSCDLENKKVDLVMVCPVFTLTEFEQTFERFKHKKEKEKLRQGSYIGYHLLNRCDIEGFSRDFLVVDFRNVFGVPVDRLVDLARNRGQRLRLLPPYREHLSQSFARFFMRVGLPVDIPPFA